MNKIEILNAKVEFCRVMLEYKKCVESSYKLINGLNANIEGFKELGIFKDINVNRPDIIMYNKLTETIKEFRKNDLDPFFFYDKSSNDYYVANFYTRYIILYLSNIIFNMQKHLTSMVDEIYLLTGDMKKLTRHYLKIIISSIKGGNMILEDRRCQLRIEKIKSEFQSYQEKLDELYELDIKKDYLEIADFSLDYLLKEDNRNKADFEKAIFVQYNMDVDFLTKIGSEEDKLKLKEIYIRRLTEFGVDIKVLDGEIEPYFTKILPESEEILDYVKLSALELYNLFVELEMQIFVAYTGSEVIGDIQKDLANLLLNASRPKETKGPEKKLK